MAQAQGGTAGSSVGRGNGSMSANGGRSQGSQNAGKNDSRGPGGSLGALAGKSNATSSSGNKAASSPSAAAKSTSSPSAAKAATTGGIMGGLTSAVQSARAARTGTTTSTMSSNIGNAVKSAFSGKDQSTSSMGIGDTSGSVSNSVGAMNTPQAKAKAESQMNAFKSGYRDQANASMTGAAFGATGAIGSAVGAGIGKITGTGYAPGSDEANTASRGAALANQNGLSSTARGLGSMAAGILGGPVGSAIASMVLGGTSYAMQRGAFPSAFDGQQDKGITSSMAQNNGSETMRNGGSNIANGMQQAAVEPVEPVVTQPAEQQPPAFEHASDYTNQRNNSLWNMNLGSII